MLNVLQQHSFYNCTPCSKAKALFLVLLATREWTYSGHIKSGRSFQICNKFKMLCALLLARIKNGKGVAVKEAAQEMSRSTGNKISEH